MVRLYESVAMAGASPIHGMLRPLKPGIRSAIAAARHRKRLKTQAGGRAGGRAEKSAG